MPFRNNHVNLVAQKTHAHTRIIRDYDGADRDFDYIIVGFDLDGGILADDLADQLGQSHRIPYFRLDGSTPTSKRKTLVKKFQEGKDASVFLLSLKAGGQGLNLTKASYVFHLDPWWNPAVENQASDRAHRIGQTQKVSILRILMRHTVEEKMMALKKQKTALYQAVLEGATHRGTGASITKEDFDFLLG